MLSFSISKCSLKLQFVKSLFGPLGSQQYCAVSVPPPLGVGCLLDYKIYVGTKAVGPIPREKKKKEQMLCLFLEAVLAQTVRTRVLFSSILQKLTSGPVGHSQPLSSKFLTAPWLFLWH